MDSIFFNRQCNLEMCSGCHSLLCGRKVVAHVPKHSMAHGSPNQLTSLVQSSPTQPISAQTSRAAAQRCPRPALLCLRRPKLTHFFGLTQPRPAQPSATQPIPRPKLTQFLGLTQPSPAQSRATQPIPNPVSPNHACSAHPSPAQPSAVQPSKII